MDSGSLWAALANLKPRGFPYRFFYKNICDFFPTAFFLKTRRNLFRAALFAITSFLVFWPPAVLIVSLIEKENGRMDVVPWYIITKGVFAFMISV